MSNTVEERVVVHSWPEMEEYKPSGEDIIDVEEEGIARTVRILKEMKPNQFFSVATITNSLRVYNPKKGEFEDRDLNNTSSFQRYLERLRENGLDVGHGDNEYGYRMPLPHNGQGSRDLIIFRRR